MSEIKIAVLGCGALALWTHLKVLARVAGVRVVALAEPDPERRARAQELAPQADIAPDYREVVARRDVDAVLIALPNALHKDAAVMAFEQGKHVYLEKPIATGTQEARPILEAWKRSGRVGMMGLNYRYNPLYRAMKQRLASGELGEMVSVRSVFTTPAHALPEWKIARATGGGALLDLATHHVDLMHFFFERPVVEASAMALSQRSEGDSAVAMLRLEGGILTHTLVSLSAVDDDRFEFYGRAGKLTADRYRSVDLEFARPKLSENTQLARFQQNLQSVAKSTYLLEKKRAVGNEPSYEIALGHFVEAVNAANRGEQPAVTPDLYDGYRSLAVIEALETSAATGRVVTLPADYFLRAGAEHNPA